MSANIARIRFNPALRLRKLRKRANYKRAVGGFWDEVGQLQFHFLIERGLKPHHHLLDIGSGSLRGGRHFIRFLEPAHYCGIEKEKFLFRLAGKVIKKEKLAAKNPKLLLNSDFDLSSVTHPDKFDFMLAISVFTHLVPEQVSLCLKRVMPRLSNRGAFFASFRESDSIKLGRPHGMRKDERMGVRYPYEFFEKLASELGLSIEYVGCWGHPRHQRMLRITNSR